MVIKESNKDTLEKRKPLKSKEWLLSYVRRVTKNSCNHDEADVYLSQEGKNIMGQKEKLIKRLKSKPRDFTFDEAERLLNLLGYERSDKGKTSGSRIAFKSIDHQPILLHKPHPRKELLAYQVKQLIEMLEEEGLV